MKSLFYTKIAWRYFEISVKKGRKGWGGKLLQK